MPAVTQLPEELLLTIFEGVLVLSDSISAYSSLLNAAHVCRRWGKAASRVLLSYVEITRREDALALLKLFKKFAALRLEGPLVETLAVGIGGVSESNLLDDALFVELLSYNNRIRKLVVLHQNSFPCIGQLPELPYLVDVTVTAAGSSPACLAETTFIQQLPANVRFLHLPGPERTRFVGAETAQCPPAFGLYGLTVHDFPTPTTKWVLSQSEETLQDLSVVYMGKLDACAESHPQLRSLRILGRLSGTSADGFKKFTNLERLEVRDLSAKPELVATLPPSLQYYRFWATEHAPVLTQMILAGRLPGMKTIVWDHYTPLAKQPAIQQAMEMSMRTTMLALQEACFKRGIELRLHERGDAGKRAQVGKDLAFEFQFRKSCFSYANERPSTSTQCDTALTRIPSRILRNMMLMATDCKPKMNLAQQFKHLSPFMNKTSGLWSPIWEDCFQGHGRWLEDTLPRIEWAMQQKCM